MPNFFHQTPKMMLYY